VGRLENPVDVGLVGLEGVAVNSNVWLGKEFRLLGLVMSEAEAVNGVLLGVATIGLSEHGTTWDLVLLLGSAK
jgi:hypothetical protein